MTERGRRRSGLLSAPPPEPSADAETGVEGTGSPAPTGATAPTPTAPSGPTERPRFAHASEAELARILDFYAVRWEYEPRVFPILWNLDGDVVESFTPDFYLPDFDLYLELTTLRQRLVRKKNRKLRRLRELYPDVRVKLFYARDFRALMLKYGRLAIAEALSGALGQVVPDRAAGVEPGAGGSEPAAPAVARRRQTTHDGRPEPAGPAHGRRKGSRPIPAAAASES